MKEAAARIKINMLLKAAGWRFFETPMAPPTSASNPASRSSRPILKVLGDNFEKPAMGFVDFLLLDEKGFPLLVLEARRRTRTPRRQGTGARTPCSQNCRFVILSNGNLHYFWDLDRGNPYVITSFPTPDSVSGYRKVTPNPGV